MTSNQSKASSNTPENDLAESTEPEIDTAGKPRLIYCLACKCHTDNKNVRIETFTRNGKERKIEQAICVKCNKKKNKFVNCS